MLLRTLVAAGLAASLLPAQGVNCQLLGRLDLYGAYNDVWGYVAPNGDEYAIHLTTTGTSIVDVSNPAAPVERGFFPGPNSTWRDARTYGTYAYVVTEGGGGFQVIDLSTPNSPTLVGTVGAAQFGNCHDICVDLGTGRIYCLGTNNGTPVFDAAANPANPPYIGNALPRGTNGNATYFHDMQVENGYAYGAMIYNGVMRIMDASGPLPMPALSDSATPGNFTHNCWPNAAGTVVVSTDEVSGGVIKFFDISNKSSPVPLGQYTPNSGSIPHNAFIVGNYCHVSWYTEGYRCIDFSDPSNPVEVASYDTWPGASGGYNGNWGCYPFLPSGNILLNDISTGLYVVRPQLTDLTLTHTPLTDTFDEDNDYDVVATSTSSNGVTGVVLNYQVNGGSVVNVPMTATGNPDEYSASIPAQLAPTRVSYSITATDPQASRTNPANGTYDFFIGSLTQVFFDDCEIDRGWTHGFVSRQDDWQRGSPAGASGTSGGVGWADPGSAFSGSSVWGNDLAPAGFNGSYQNNVLNYLDSPSINTNGVQGLRLRYRRWITLASGDVGRVYVNGVLVATVPANTRDTSWQLIEHDISSITNTAPTMQIRYELQTDATVVAGGWNLDDIEVFAESDCVPPVFYGTATAGSSGISPVIAMGGDPRIGTTAQINGSGFLGSTSVIWALSLSRANLPTNGITALVDPNLSAFAFGVTTGPTNVPGVGVVNFPVSIPPNPSLDNMDLFNQLVGLDPGSVGGTFSATNGMRFRVCSQ